MDVKNCCAVCAAVLDRRIKIEKKGGGGGGRVEVTNLANKLSLLGCLKAPPAINVLPFGSLRNIQVFTYPATDC